MDEYTFMQLSKNQVEVKYQAICELFDRVKRRYDGSLRKMLGVIKRSDRRLLSDLAGDAVGLLMQEEISKGRTRINHNDASNLVVEIESYLNQFRNAKTGLIGGFSADYKRPAFSW